MDVIDNFKYRALRDFYRDWYHTDLQTIAIIGYFENFEIFNIGTGKGSSVLEVINAFGEVSSLKLNYKIEGRRKGDVISAYADTTKANIVLGWKAELSLKYALLSWKWENR